MPFDSRLTPHAPPRTLNFEGQPRRIGVEVEFAVLSARDVALKLCREFGGRVEERNPHRFRVADTELGTFIAELDTQYAHPVRTAGQTSDAPLFASFEDIVDRLRVFYGDVSSLIVPCEIASPPLTLDNLVRFDAFVAKLTEAGAAGTGSSPFYAFGAHLNPDIATMDAAWITAVLKAEMLLSEWLRQIMSIDLTRLLTSFVDPFPERYVKMVVSPDYWPDTTALIDDYLASNPTRDRELDMLPLFAWIDEVKVRRAAPAVKIGKRPAFHYRLPNANLGEPGWSLGLEWNRWCVIERLADDRPRLDAMGAAYIENRQRLLPERWAVRASEWLVV